MLANDNDSCLSDDDKVNHTDISYSIVSVLSENTRQDEQSERNHRSHSPMLLDTLDCQQVLSRCQSTRAAHRIASKHRSPHIDGILTSSLSSKLSDNNVQLNDHKNRIRPIQTLRLPSSLVDDRHLTIEQQISIDSSKSETISKPSHVDKTNTFDDHMSVTSVNDKFKPLISIKNAKTMLLDSVKTICQMIMFNHRSVTMESNIESNNDEQSQLLEMLENDTSITNVSHNERYCHTNVTDMNSTNFIPNSSTSHVSHEMDSTIDKTTYELSHVENASSSHTMYDAMLKHDTNSLTNSYRSSSVCNYCLSFHLLESMYTCRFRMNSWRSFLERILQMMLPSFPSFADQHNLLPSIVPFKTDSWSTSISSRTMPMNASNDFRPWWHQPYTIDRTATPYILTSPSCQPCWSLVRLTRQRQLCPTVTNSSFFSSHTNYSNPSDECTCSCYSSST
jgi:hypothetical protein